MRDQEATQVSSENYKLSLWTSSDVSLNDAKEFERQPDHVFSIVPVSKIEKNDGKM